MTQAKIHYRLLPITPAAHLFQVQITLNTPDPGGQLLSLPAWIPGSYMIRDFARQIQSISAESDGAAVGLTKENKHTWRVDPVGSSLVITYQVYAWDLSVRSAHLDQTHGFFNGSSLFLCPHGQEHLPMTLDIELPTGDAYQQWCIATSLPKQEDGLFVARDYEHLIDCPVEMGSFSSLEFEVQTVPHSMVVSGRVNFDAERIAGDLSKVCAEHARMFDELPVQSYLFLVQAVNDGYGGLEHRDSTALICKKSDLPQVGMKSATDGYRDFLGLCSHEYFHLWMVKRIRPARLVNADLGKEQYTNLLWAFEGITSYYDDLALVRSSCLGVDQYLQTLAKTITRVLRTPGRFKQSVAESSFDAWTKFYKQDENSPNAIVSYYAKGALVAFGLDMRIRELTADAKSLDDLMRKLWVEYGRPNIGVPEDGIEQVAVSVAGCELTEFFNYAVYGTKDLPLEDWCDQVGVGFRLRPTKGADDLGGSAKQDEQVSASYELGAKIAQKGDLVEVQQVFDGGAAQLAGISAGDRLIAMSGLQISATSLPGLLQASAGAEVEVLAFRRDELMSFNLRPQLSADNTCDLWLIPDEQCSQSQIARRNSWLNLS